MADARQRATGARIRAATAYADLRQPQVARHFGYSVRSWARVEAGEKQLDAGELERLAELTGVPVEFLRDGFRAGRDDLAAQTLEQVRENAVLMRGLMDRYADERDQRVHDSTTQVLDTLAELAAQVQRLADDMVANQQRVLALVERLPADDQAALARRLAGAFEQGGPAQGRRANAS